MKFFQWKQKFIKYDSKEEEEEKIKMFVRNRFCFDENRRKESEIELSLSDYVSAWCIVYWDTIANTHNLLLLLACSVHYEVSLQWIGNIIFCFSGTLLECFRFSVLLNANIMSVTCSFQSENLIYLTSIPKTQVLKMGQTRPILFFCSFHITNLAQI